MADIEERIFVCTPIGKSQKMIAKARYKWEPLPDRDNLFRVTMDGREEYLGPAEEK